MKKVSEQIQEELKSADFRTTFVSTEHLPELSADYEKLLKEKTLNKDFYDEIVSRYGLEWQFELPPDFPGAKSIIITAAAQPKTSLEFVLAGQKYYAIIPPTYIYDTDQQIMDTISPLLKKHGYQMKTALLPTKLLAVRSGLAKYGRNNVTYVDGWGSYHRLRVFFSDMPCNDACWQEPVALELCSKCEACIKKCPTRAISADRFLLDAGRCLTFFNEANEEFPKWIDPAWHNCLIGCMICQDVCPVNKDHTAWIIPGGDFSEEETKMILDGIPRDKLPVTTTDKLRRVRMLDDYELLRRNLGALISKSQKNIQQDR